MRASIIPCRPPMQSADGHEQRGDRRHQDGGLQQVEHAAIFQVRREGVTSEDGGRRGKVQSTSGSRRGSGAGSKTAPTAGVQPRRSASAAMRRPPARCSSVSASRPWPQATVSAPPSTPTTSPRPPVARANDAAPAGDRLAGQDAPRPRRRVESAQAALDLGRRRAPVDRRLGLGDLGGVGDADLGLGPAVEPGLGERAERLDDEIAAQRGQPRLQARRRFRRRRSRASRRRASRRCRGRHPSA